MWAVHHHESHMHLDTGQAVGTECCAKNLVGRFLADKSFSSGTVEAVMYSIWRQSEAFKVVDHGKNIFQFFFGDEKDMLRIERGVPWLFKNYILNLRRWNEDENNIKIWDLAEQFKTKELGRKIGGSFGEVLDVDIFHVRGKEHSIVKIQIGTFCNYCGFIGHETRACSFRIEDLLKGEVEEEKWGDWLKANQTERKESTTKDNPNTNMPKGEDSSYNRVKKPTPINLIKGLVNLCSLGEERRVVRKKKL
ncbi:hypothetical protein Ahy_B08g092624 [Arachis hypogaea]|uniref:DUF4283 domain-containing protein n=1 Tax=Arachis hypogaea TaxID=3818 RepID=A0A444Y4A4_ARAHY|nr:hypothetical protein Ahy_B08g092624 [Arachis hypogaea]